nr:MAG TPA: hypothetical protein [Caudoviricetes sp.]
MSLLLFPFSVHPFSFFVSPALPAGLLSESIISQLSRLVNPFYKVFSKYFSDGT